MFVLYGRRRVGKTELLRHFCEDKPHIFFIATFSSDFDQLASFSQEIWRFTHENVPEGFTFPSWEAAFRAHVARLARQGQLTFLPERVGSWWDRTGEVDAVAISDVDGALLLGGCKWSVSPVGIDVLGDLQRKARLVDPEGRWPSVSYALFAKAGFTPALEARAAAENVRLLEPEALVMGGF